MRFRIFLLGYLALLYGCSHLHATQASDVPSEQALIQKIKKGMHHHNYHDVNEASMDMMLHYPQSAYNQQAMLNNIYAYYQAHDIDNTMHAADQFMSLYPYSPHRAYAQYMKGMVLLSQHGSWIQRKVHFSTAKMDVAHLKQAFYLFKKLLIEHPHSKYAENARYMMWRLKVSIARSELNAAKVYFEKGAYVATINRAREALAVDDRLDQAHVRQAKKLIKQSYQALGLKASS